MGKTIDFINALTELGDGRYHYWDGQTGIGCSDYVRMALGLAGVITQEEAENPYSLWAAQHYRPVLRDKTRFEELPVGTNPVKGDILWYHGYHVSVCAGGTDVWEAAPENTHGICSNGKTGVGLWKNHDYNCSGGALTCIYRIIEEEQPKEFWIKAWELCDRAINVCLGRCGDTSYNNTYPHNIGRWNGSAWTFDCLGFVHTLVNGFINDREKLGGGAVRDDFVLNTNEEATLQSCTNISKFNGTVPKRGSLLQSSGHVGIYIGDIEIDGKIYNTAECTKAWECRCLLSWVDINTGYRYRFKNGEYRSIWNYHGELGRVDYSDETQEIIMPSPEEPKPKAVLTEVQKLMTAIEVINRKWGDNPVRREKLTEMYGSETAIQIQELVNLAYEKRG